jgi:type II secretory pathway component PulJ
VTLLEMLVVVGLLVLIMTILVEIFRTATGALTTQRAMAALDMDMRRADAAIRQDLMGVTAKMTPSNNPKDERGYFTYTENALADSQGEDTDDMLAFTAKAPEGRPFTGSMTVPVTVFDTTLTPPAFRPVPGAFNRVPISSELAEVIYFLRAGNLYRRVLLVLPKDRQSIIRLGTDTTGAVNQAGGFLTSSANLSPSTGLFGVNMSWQGLNDISARPSPTLLRNSLGVVVLSPPTLNTLGDLTNRQNRAFSPRFVDDFSNNTSGAPVPDGIPDDVNGNGIPDFYPTLYPQILTNAARVNDPGNGTRNTFVASNPQVLSFPFVYPNGYSASSPAVATPPYGAIHGLNSASGNHAPIDLGDPLESPTPSGIQAWWGLPTKKETMSLAWTDPVKQVHAPALIPGEPVFTQSLGLRPAFSFLLGASPSVTTLAALPPLSSFWRNIPEPSPGLTVTPPFVDGTAGSTSFALPVPPAVNREIWKALPEDDLILSNVRSFDIKGLDPVLNQYVDLGYLNQLTGTTTLVDFNGDGISDGQTYQTLGHEGRIPPLIADGRADPQFPALLPNIGDDTASVVRLRRVWDSWSTDYSNVPAQTLDPRQGPPVTNPPYPSYPPPYPAPLRGIQIQVRVVDPTNQRIKLHTIRQDFSDKLN